MSLKPLIINHSMTLNKEASHQPVMGNNIVADLSDQYEIVNSDPQSLNGYISKYKNRDKKYIFVYGIEKHQFKNFFREYMNKFYKNNFYNIYLGLILVRETPADIDHQLKLYKYNLSHFFVDSFTLHQRLKFNIPLSFPFLSKTILENVRKTEVKKNTVFLDMRRVAISFAFGQTQYKYNTLVKALTVIKRNSDHHFYIDARLHNIVLNIVRGVLKGANNWELKRQSNNHIEYLKFKASVEKHIILMQTFQKMRTSGTVLELIGLNRQIITVNDNNWMNNFILSIQYPNAMFYKDLLHINLKAVPDIMDYQFYDKFIDQFSTNDIKKLIMRKEIKLSRSMILFNGETKEEKEEKKEKKKEEKKGGEGILFCCVEPERIQKYHKEIKQLIEKRKFQYFLLSTKFLQYERRFSDIPNLYFLEKMVNPLFVPNKQYRLTSFIGLIRFCMFHGYKEIRILKDDLKEDDQLGIQHIQHDISTYFRDVNLVVE